MTALPTGSPAHQVPPGHKIHTFILIF
jgi:hypothetical protein